MAVAVRTLLDEDEQPGAAPVVVIGYDVWRSRFGGDPAVVGQEIRIGRAAPAIVLVRKCRESVPICTAESATYILYI